MTMKNSKHLFIVTNKAEHVLTRKTQHNNIIVWNSLRRVIINQSNCFVH